MKRQKVISYIEENEESAIMFLCDLLKIDSSDIGHGLDGQEEKAQLFLKKRLEQIGMETHLCEPDYERIKEYPECAHGHSYAGRPNLVGIMKGQGEGRSLILNGHVDTMAAGNKELWTYDPWSATREGDNIYALGACDMKAGLAAMILAAEAVLKFCKLKGDLILESVVDEEGGGNGTLDLTAQGYTADAAIIAEPTELKIMSASRGVLVTHIRVTGEASHPNYKWEKANAVEKAIKVYQGLYELEHRWLAVKNHPMLPRPTITLGKIQGGVAGTAIPASCDMDFDIEFLPEEYALDGTCRKTNGKDILQEVMDAVMRVSDSDPWLKEHKPEIHVDQWVEPHSVNPDFEMIKILQRNHGEGIVSAFPAGCDARHLAQAGIPAVIYGPGSMSDAHNINEKVSISQYIKCIKTMALTIMDWCGIEE